jgi:hypothetical protein
VSEPAMRTLTDWFGADAIRALEVPH